MNSNGSFDSFGTFLRTVEKKKRGADGGDPSQKILALAAIEPQKMSVLIRQTKQTPKALSENIRDLEYMNFVKVDDDGIVSATPDGLDALSAMQDNAL